MNTTTDGTDSYRYERKFTVPLYMVQNLPTLLHTSSYGFREIYAERYVNNIYYDTPLFCFYHENVQGLAKRKKIRIRWYGDAQLPEYCRFEIKRKNGGVGTKDVAGVSCTFSDSLGMPEIKNVQVPKNYANEITCIFPTLINRYRRRYFLSANGKFRATIDYDLCYSHPSTANQNSMGYRDNEAVLEFKYHHEFDRDMPEIAFGMPFSISKKSKYVTGIGMVYDC